MTRTKRNDPLGEPVVVDLDALEVPREQTGDVLSEIGVPAELETPTVLAPVHELREQFIPEPQEVHAGLSLASQAISAVSAAPSAPAPMTLSEIEGLIVDMDEGVDNPTTLIYGKNGTGKTTILSTIEGMLVFAIDDGTLSIRDKAKGKAKKIIIDTWEKVEKLYFMLDRGTKTPEGIMINTAGGSFYVKAVGFDTITKLASLCLRSVVLGDKAKLTDKDTVFPTLKQYGEMAQKLTHWLGLYKALNIKNVWICQETSNTESTDDEEYSVTVDVQKKVKTFILAEADVIGRTMISKVDDGSGKVVPQFGIAFLPNGKFITKDRTGVLPSYLANPNLDVIYNKIFKGVN